MTASPAWGSPRGVLSWKRRWFMAAKRIWGGWPPAPPRAPAPGAKPARRALLEASVVYGGERHLAMLPARLAARRAAWPKPFDLAPLLAERTGAVCVLASGGPMLVGG